MSDKSIREALRDPNWFCAQCGTNNGMHTPGCEHYILPARATADEQINDAGVVSAPTEQLPTSGAHSERYPANLTPNVAPASPIQAAGEPALGYAQRLALSIWARLYRADSPEFKPLGDMVGVLTQIDNMVSGMTRTAPPKDEVAALIERLQDMARFYELRGRLYEAQTVNAAADELARLSAPVPQPRMRKELAAELQLARTDGYREGLTVGWQNGRKNALEEIETERAVAAAAPVPAKEK